MDLGVTALHIAEVEVGDFEVKVFVEKEVLKFEIKVVNVLGVEVFHAFNELVEVSADELLILGDFSQEIFVIEISILSIFDKQGG